MSLQYRFVLQNYTGGELVVAEPPGADELVLNLKRHPLYYGLNTEQSLSKLSFLGAAKTYIVDIIEDESVTEAISLRIDISEDGGTTYEELTQMELDLQDFEIDQVDSSMGDSITVGLRQQGSYNRLLSRHEIKIDLGKATHLGGGTLSPSIPFDTFTLLGYHLRLQCLFEMTQEFNSGYTTDPLFTSAVNEDVMIFTTPDRRVIDEIDDFQTQSPFAQVYTANLAVDLAEDSRAILNLTKDAEAGTYVFPDDNAEGGFRNYIELQWDASNRNLITFHLERASGPDNITSATLKLWIAHKSGSITSTLVDTVTMTVDNTGTPWAYAPPTVMNWTLDPQFSQVTPGDKLYLYWTIEVTPNNNNTYDFYYNKILDPDYPTTKDTLYVRIDSDRGSFDVEGFSVHDAGLKICNAITEKNNSFQSEYLGNTANSYIAYSENGNGSFNIVTSGKKLRGDVSIGALYVSFEEWFRSLDALYNLGMHIENEGGNVSDDFIRVEEKRYFFVSGSPSLTISAVDNITKKRAADLMFSSVEIGFAEFAQDTPQSVNAISTKREYASIISDFGKRKQIISPMICDYGAIEITRRQTDIETRRYKYDEKNFIIAMNRDIGAMPDVSMLNNEEDENFSSLASNTQGFFNMATAYNLQHTPGRMFLRWGNIVNTGLINDPATFWRPQNIEGNNLWDSTTTGVTYEGNYENNNFQEKENLQWDYGANPVEQTPIFKQWAYEFMYPITFQEYKTLRDNKRNTISIPYEGASIEVYLWSLEYNPMSPKETKFVCIEANV